LEEEEELFKFKSFYYLVKVGLGVGLNREGFTDRLKRTRLGRKIRFARLPSPRFPKPPAAIVGMLLILLSIYILGGGVYIQLEKTMLALIMSQDVVSIAYPRFDHQTSGEAYVVASLYIIGILGLFLSFLSTRYIYKPRYAHITLFIGLTLLVISFYVTWDILQAKAYGQKWP